MILDGSELGMEPSLDVNGATLLASNIVLFSFDGAGQVGGVAFEDEDLVQFDNGTETFTLHTDGSALSASLSAVDITAVPEPGFAFSLGVACLGIAALRSRERRR